MKGIVMTRAQVEAHQRKHGFMPTIESDAAKENAKNLGWTKPKARRMNNTEVDYAFILEAMKRRGEILRYEFEGITLRWADMKYTPDFVVFGYRSYDNDGVWHHDIRFIEVKGGHIWSRDMVRFKGARAFWPEFEFEMHQKKKGQWNQIK